MNRRQRGRRSLQSMAMSKPRHVLRRKLNDLELALFGPTPPSAGEVRAALEPLVPKDSAEAQSRAGGLVRLAAGGWDRAAYRDEHGVAGVRQFATSAGGPRHLIPGGRFPPHPHKHYPIPDS